MQTTTAGGLAGLVAKIGGLSGRIFMRATTAAIGGDPVRAATLKECANDLVDLISEDRPQRGRPKKADVGTIAPGQRLAGETAAAAAANQPAKNARKIKLEDVPAILAKEHPGGASEEEVRALLGWKATAPMASFHKGLVNTGKVIRADNLYRAAQPAAQQQERATA